MKYFSLHSKNKRWIWRTTTRWC